VALSRDISPEILEMMPPTVARELRAIPIGLDEGGALIVAMADMFDYDAAEKLRFILKRNITVRNAIPAGIEYAIQRYYS
jgi:hypothetical protein